MTILSDGTLKQLIHRGELGIEPFSAKMIQPASIDVCASGHFRVFRNDGITHIDPRLEQPSLTEETIQDGDEPFVLHPGEFVLGSTIERFRLPHHIMGRLEGRSSLGRLGLVIHSTAGFIDPGFDGTITLELSNNATLPICLWASMSIGQVSFEFLDKPAEVTYGDPGRRSKYQGQVGPTASRMHENFETESSTEEDPLRSGVLVDVPHEEPNEGDRECDRVDYRRVHAGGPKLHLAPTSETAKTEPCNSESLTQNARSTESTHE